MVDEPASPLAYDNTLPFDHPHNKAFAKQKGWRVDLDWRWYRDHNGLLVDQDGAPPLNPVHQLR